MLFTWLYLFEYTCAVFIRYKQSNEVYHYKLLESLWHTQSSNRGKLYSRTGHQLFSEPCQSGSSLAGWHNTSAKATLWCTSERRLYCCRGPGSLTWRPRESVVGGQPLSESSFFDWGSHTRQLECCLSKYAQLLNVGASSILRAASLCRIITEIEAHGVSYESNVI